MSYAELYAKELTVLDSLAGAVAWFFIITTNIINIINIIIIMIVVIIIVNTAV